MSIETIMNAMFSPPDPAPEVVTLGRSMVEELLTDLEDDYPLRQAVFQLRAALAEPKEELWVTFSHGPNEIHPFLSKEAAEEDAAETAKLCNAVAEREGWGGEWVMPHISILPSPYAPAEHYQLVAKAAIERTEGLVAAYKKADDDRSKLLAAAEAVLKHFAPDSLAGQGDGQAYRVMSALADTVTDVTAEEVAQRKGLEAAQARHKANVERLKANRAAPSAR